MRGAYFQGFSIPTPGLTIFLDGCDILNIMKIKPSINVQKIGDRYLGTRGFYRSAIYDRLAINLGKKIPTLVAKYLSCPKIDSVLSC
jgi:hypothetical protein